MCFRFEHIFKVGLVTLASKWCSHFNSGHIMGFTILDLTMYKPKTYGSFELSAKKRATSPPH